MPAQTFTNTGIALRCYAPVQLEGGRNAAGDLTLSWVRRARVNAAWLNLTDVPLDEVTEQYIVSIYSSSTYATLKNAWLVATTTTIYLAADQTTDFGSPQATIYWTVAQIGKLGSGLKGYGIS